MTPIESYTVHVAIIASILPIDVSVVDKKYCVFIVLITGDNRGECYSV
ncbi:hypothetical protein Xenpb_02706 [Xenorhabdus sp. PB62.4]|nr:hypothetical protein [Xenorhabdus sp. PB62.4]